MNPSPFIVGLTGGIGSGKSVAAEHFALQGIDIVDTDVISHTLTSAHGKAIPAIRRTFGETVIGSSGELNRRAMRDLVFSDACARQRLESILHPLIRTESLHECQAASSPYVILAVPLLIESGHYRERCQRICVVDCPVEMQIARVQARSGLNEEQILTIIATQASREERLAAADDVIDNSTDLISLQCQVMQLHERYLRLAGKQHHHPITSANNCRTGSPCSVRIAKPYAIFMAAENAFSPTSFRPYAVIIYEYPLKERIRTLLRLEDLYRKLDFFSKQESPENHHAALITLFEILEVAKRADLKVDLMQELERQRQILIAFKNNPAISEEALRIALDEIARAATSLQAMSGKLGQSLRENEWLMTIRSRAAIPGGVCEFDLPSYHYWLNRSVQARSHDLDSWIRTIIPVRDGLAIVLRLLRASAEPEQQVAQKGVYQLMMTGKTAQMLRVQLADNEAAVPEISASKHALNIRFLLPETLARPHAAKHDITFGLSLCSL